MTTLLDIGDELQVNSYTANDQFGQAVATLSDGTYVIVWRSDYQDGHFGSLFAQHYSASGQRLGAEFQVNTYTDRDTQPAISAFSDGGYIIVWQSGSGDSHDIYALRFGADGNAVGTESRINTYTGNFQVSPVVTVLSGGGHVIAWFSYDGQDGDGAGIFVQRFDGDGAAVGAETRVNTCTAGDQSYPAVAPADDGGYVVAWQASGQDGSGLAVYSQRYDAAGDSVGPETLVNTTTLGNQRDPSIAALDGGGFVVTWTSEGQDGSEDGIYAQRYDSLGNAIGLETQVNTTTDSFQIQSAIAGLTDGGYVIAWNSLAQDGDGYGVYAQRFDAAGGKMGPETHVSTYTVGDQGGMSAAGLAGGGYVVTWDSWAQDGSKLGVYQKVFSVAGDLAADQEGYGTVGGDIIDSGAGDDSLYGGPGDDELVGGDGDDWLDGGGGADSLYGGAGDDTYIVDNTDDFAHEDDLKGLDTVEASVSWALDNNIENLILTGTDNINGLGNRLGNGITGNAGHNTLTGGVANDTLNGGDGNDTLDGRAGANSLSGGAGDDRLDYQSRGFVVSGGRLRVNGDAYMSRAVDLSAGATVSGVVTEENGYGGLLRRYDATILFGSDGQSSSGYGIQISRGDENYSNSGIDLIVNQRGIDRIWAPFQFGASVTFSVTLATDGTISGTVASDGNSFNFNFGPRSVTLTIDAIALAQDSSDTRSAIITQATFDNVTIHTATGDVVDDFNRTNGVVGNGWITEPGSLLDGGVDTDTAVLDMSFETRNLIYDGVASADSAGAILVDSTIIRNIESVRLTAGSGNDRLVSGSGGDTFSGSAGDDTYVVGIGDVISENTDEGDDTVFSSMSYVLGGNVENLILTGAEAIDGTGNGLNNVITGNDGANNLSGGDGDDRLIGGPSGLSSPTTAYVSGAKVELLSFDGSGYDATRVGAPTMAKVGDHYVMLFYGMPFGNNMQIGLALSSDGVTWSKYGSDPVITNGESQGWDSFREVPVTLLYEEGVYRLWFNGDNTNLATNPGRINGWGYATSTDGIHWTQPADNLIRGEVSGPAGKGYALKEVVRLGDEYHAYFTHDLPGGFEFVHAVSGDGVHFTDTIPVDVDAGFFHLSQGYGLVAARTIDLNGTPTMISLWFNGVTWYYLTSLDGVSFTNRGTISLPDGFETEGMDIRFDEGQLTLYSGLNVGNVNWGSVNVKIASATLTLPDLGSPDRIDGGAGRDTAVINLAHETRNVVYNGAVATTGTGYTLIGGTNIRNVEQVELITGTGADNLSGGIGNDVLSTSAGNDVLSGFGGDDSLDGGGGGDRMYGGAGNDTYFVDYTGDKTYEYRTPGVDEGGVDTVNTAISLTLGDYLEDLILTGGDTLRGYGNGLDNTVTGNTANNQLRGLAGNDVLEGGVGSDTLYGGAGDDTYIVDSAGDKALEYLTAGVDDGGTDIVRASVTFTAGAFVENLTLTGADAINAYGNTLANILSGNSGNNRLDGRAGADTLSGAAGADTYYVDNPGDLVIETVAAGADTVYAAVSYDLVDYVENLTLAGTGDFDATGNDLINILKGNSGINRLFGGAGNDLLTGGGGADDFVFSHFGAANGVDHLKDFVSGLDHLSFTAADFGFAPGHALTAAEFSTSGASIGATAQFVYSATKHALYWDANGSVSGGATMIALFDNLAAPTLGDFVFT